MNKQEAIKLMKEGKRLTHRWFSPDEWMTYKDGSFQFEDGCQTSITEFFEIRSDETWGTDWELFLENEND